MGLAIGSFIIYAVATVVLNQPRDAQYDTERSSLAAAVSNVVYGAPIGTVFTGVLARLWDPSRPMQQTFEETARREVQTGSLLNATTDGNGVGYPVLASLALRVFGLHLSSLVFALITLMAISTVAFLSRYQDDRLLFVPLYFFSLTVMLFTPLATDTFFVSQIPVGGIRYLSLVGILPAMHILLEVTEPSKVHYRAAIKNSVLLGIQVLLLAISVIVRSSAGYLVVAVVVSFFVVIRTYASNDAALRNIIQKGVLGAVSSALLVALFVAWVPKGYKESGRATGLVWHRVLVSLGANPAWPFGGLPEIYRCYQFIPEGLVPGITDRNGHCVWVSYGLNHGLSAGAINDGIYSGRYETIMQKAFFNIARLYPVQVLETFVYYKPKRFLSTMRQLIDIDVARNSVTMIPLLVLQVVNLTLFVVCGTGGSSERRVRSLTRAIALFSIFALLPVIVVWSNPFTTADPLFYFFVILGLVLSAAIEAMHKFIGQPHPGVPM